MNNKTGLLNHVAIPLRYGDDIQSFYTDILGFTELYRFVIDQETALTIFNTDIELNVSVVEKDGLKIELFHIDEPGKPGIAHICLTVSNITEICLKAEKAGYQVIRILRPTSTIAFLIDKTGNRIELKENESSKEYLPERVYP